MSKAPLPAQGPSGKDRAGDDPHVAAAPPTPPPKATAPAPIRG